MIRTRRTLLSSSACRQRLATAALLLAAGLLAGCASLALPGAGVTTGRHGWNQVAQTGQGTPPVIFEAGAGDDAGVWKPVFPQVAEFTEAFAYSRRGAGLSSPKLLPRTGRETVEELRALLHERGLRPPYVLVGHSLGGLYMELFAKLYPAEVAGLVLVDPTHPDHLQRLKERFPGKYALVQSMKVLGQASSLGPELMGAAETGRQWHAAGPMPRIPIIVLTASRATRADGPEFAQFTGALQTELVRQWPGAEQRFVDATHYIQKERPTDVVRAIREVVDRAREPGPAR